MKLPAVQVVQVVQIGALEVALNVPSAQAGHTVSVVLVADAPT
jgi:hypothetical protein